MTGGVVALVLLLGFVFFAVPIGFALSGATLAGLLAFGDAGALTALSNISWGATSEFVLTAVPLFILMSEIISFTGIGRDLFLAIERWLGRLPGGLAMTGVVACAAFGAVAGTGVGVAAVIGGVAIPEMVRRGYTREMSTGTVAASSALGMIIPPSLPLILYGVVTETPIADLFLAGLVPGALIIAAFCLYITVAVSLGHGIEPDAPRPRFTWAERLASIRLAGPTIILIVAVIGSIYAGIATPTEAAAVGVIGALLLAAVSGKLSWPAFRTALVNATRTSCMVMFVLIGAMLFGYLLGLLRVPQGLSDWVLHMGLSRWAVFALLMVAYFVLGMFLEVTSIILITMPIVYPTIIKLGFDPVWFAMVLIVNMSFAVITPPVGLCLYVAKSCLPGTSIAQVVRGTLPFMGLLAAVIVVLCLFPELVTGFIR
ncbi:TRAP transporter large permease [Tistrella mobilis]